MLRLKRELHLLHMSQAECARRSGINQTSLSRIMMGKEPAYPQRGKRIADAIGWEKDPTELFKEVIENESDEV